MLKELIATQLSTKELKYKPGGPIVSFEVNVVNQSNQFATFEIDIQAAGTEADANPYWYSLTPNISTKKPPGDSTQFSVQILDNPKPGFVGLMNLIVRVSSLELRQEERQILRLLLEPGTAFVPFKIELPVPAFQAHPDELIEIPVEIENPGQLAAEAMVYCSGVPAAWLTEGAERRLRIKPEAKAKTSFLCQIPAPAQAPSQIYPLVIEASKTNEPASRAEGILHVLPSGSIDFSCTPLEQQVPSQRSWLPNWKAKTATFQAHFQNQSNLLTQQVGVEVTPGDKQPVCQLQITPERADLAINGMAQLDLVVHKRRRWFGIARKYLFEAKGVTSAPQIDIRNDTQLIKLILHPVFPLWLQLLSVCGLLWLLWGGSCLNPRNSWCGHTAAVNSVRFNGIGDKLASGSDDQSMIDWRVDGFGNPLVNQNTGAIGKPGKAIRVLRYRPVNNDRLAVGLENGEIQIWSAVTGNREPLQTLSTRSDDRVFDLAFTPDSRSLFSGHGSGSVVQWNLEPGGGSTEPTKQREQQVGFAVNALGLVGEAGSHLAIGGRFNQLTLWDLKTNTLRSINNGRGSEANYILSLATASSKPYLLASADNQGTVKVWNLRPCLTSRADCQLLDEWTPDKAVRSIAFSTDGCYLASAGDDGRAMLWSLNPTGDRSGRDLDGKVLGKSSQSLNSIDVVRLKDEVLVTSGGDDHQVKLYRTKVGRSICY
jgi:WD40 repeat protein